MDNTIDNIEWVDAITPTHRDIAAHTTLLDADDDAKALVDVLLQLYMRQIETGVCADRLDMALDSLKRARALMQAWEEIIYDVP